MSSGIASIRERLNNIRMQREMKQSENTGELAQDSTGNTGNTTDHRTWIKRIEQQGNKAEEWLQYMNFLSQSVHFDSESARDEYIRKMYSRAVKAISSSGGHKCESYARLFVNYANFVSQTEVDEARDLFYIARTNLVRFAIVHIYAAQFELQQGQKDKCRKIFEKALEVEAKPSELLETAHMNFLFGYDQFISDDTLAQYTGLDQTDGKPNFDVSRDSGISLVSGRSDNTTGNLTDRDLKDSSLLYNSKRCHSTRTGSSSDDSLPLSTSASDHAFSRPPLPKSSLTATKTASFIKPPPVRRELISSVSSEGDLSTDQGVDTPSHSASMLNQAYPVLPGDLSTNEEEGTISFNMREKGRKRDASSDQDTVPLSFDASAVRYSRPLRSSHSTPDCKNPGMLSMVSSRKKRFVGQARRVLPQVKEGDDVKPRTDELSLPIMPDLDTSHTLEILSTNPITCVGSSSMNKSSTLTINTSSAQSTLVETPSHNRSMNRSPNPAPSQIQQSQHSMQPQTQSNQQPNQLQTHSTHERSQHQNSEPRQPIAQPQPKSQLPQSYQPAPQQSSQPMPAQPVIPQVSVSQPQAVPTPAAPVQQPLPAVIPVTPQHYNQTPQAMSGQMYNPQFGFTPNAKQEILVINQKAYTILNCIGQGGTSSVVEVLNVDRSICAVKIVNMAGADEATIKSYKNEIALLQRLQTSDRVVSMYDHEFNPRSNLLYVVMERGDTDLATFFSRNKIHDIKIMYFWQEMLEAVQVLHNEGIVHTDLKPANFLLVAGHLKLIDFGIAKAIQQDMTSVTTDQQVGTLNFMSPEALMAGGEEEDENGEIRRKHKIGYKSDVWSLGCILYRMVYGRTPFQSIRNQIEKMRAIINPNHHIKFPEIPNVQLRDVIKKCLLRDPYTRPAIDELLRHPYLKGQPKDASPAAGAPSQEALMRLMQQVATASPNSFSAVKQNVQGLLAQLQSAGSTQQPKAAPAPAIGSELKAGPRKDSAQPRHGQRAPLASMNQNNKPQQDL